MQNEIKKKELSNDDLFSEEEFTKKVGNYILTEQIGFGNFSKVAKGTHTITGQDVAIKILDKSRIKDEIDIKHICREIEILKSISHKNIVQLYESISTEHNFYLILEYIDGGDLGDFISKKISLPENLACRFFRQLISAIEYLNYMGVTHRDIKPENILLDSSHNNIKVIDFGLSNYCSNAELFKSACGSPCFASPEMISGNSYLGVTTDLWSAGIVLYSMLVGTLPFADQDINILYEHIKIGTFYIPSSLSLESIDFLKKILQVNPDKRITIEEIKEHKWFNLEKNILYKGIDLTVETFPYNETLINYIINKFYKDEPQITKENFVKMIQYHACNQYTSTYYLFETYLEKNKIYKLEKSILKENDIIKEKDDYFRNNKNEREQNIKNYKNFNNNKSNKKEIMNHINTRENKINFKQENNNNRITSLWQKKQRKIISRNKKIDDNRIITDNIKKYFSIKNNNKKLSHKISSIFHYLNDLKISDNNSLNEKPKSWSKKRKIFLSINNRKGNKRYINDKFGKNQFQIKQSNFQTEINMHNLSKNNLGLYNKGKEISLKNKGDISNSNQKEEINTSKMFCVKIEKNNKSKKTIFPRNKENKLNKTEKNSLNCINLSKYNEKMKDKKTLETYEKFHKLSSNKNKRRIYITTNFNNKLNNYQNNYFLTERNNNNIQMPESNHSLVLIKQKYLEQKNIKNQNINKSFNKYKNLIDEFSTVHSDNKKEQKKKESEYFPDNIKDNKKHKQNNQVLTDTSNNKSITSNTKILNNKIDNKFLKNAITLSLKNKIHTNIKTNKSKFNNKNIKQNKILNINLIDKKISNNKKLSKFFYNKLKIKTINEKSNENNLNYISYIKTERMNSNENKKNQNPNRLKKLSLSPCNKNNYNKTPDNNKIINININNILKIKKQYSLSLAKSNHESYKNSIYNNNNFDLSNNSNQIKVKNNYSTIPVSLEKKRGNKTKNNIHQHHSKNNDIRIKTNIYNPKIKIGLKSDKNYSSMLKKQLLFEQLYKKNE